MPRRETQFFAFSLNMRPPPRSWLMRSVPKSVSKLNGIGGAHSRVAIGYLT